MTLRNLIVSSLTGIVVTAAGIVAFAGLNLGGGGGYDVDIAEAHDVYDRYLTGFHLPDGQQFRINLATGKRTINDDGGGCHIGLPSDGEIPIPEGATTVTVPANVVITVTEGDGCSTTVGDTYPGSLGNIPGTNIKHSMRMFSNYSVSVASSTTRIRSVLQVGHTHDGVATGATGTGFYCGRRYDWSEFEPGESRALYLTHARRSLIGWVYVGSDGRHIASCAGHRLIFRPANQ